MYIVTEDQMKQLCASNCNRKDVLDEIQKQPYSEDVTKSYETALDALKDGINWYRKGDKLICPNCHKEVDILVTIDKEYCFEVVCEDCEREYFPNLVKE